MKRKKQEKQEVLEKDLAKKEEVYFKSPSPILLNEITALRSTLDALLTQNAEKKVKYVKQKYYEHGDKPGKYLAYLTKKRSVSQYITSITGSNGSQYYDNKRINICFKDFYTDLYTSELTNTSSRAMDDFFSSISLPAITEEQRIILNAPITREEVLNAIKMLQNGKASGPDGLNSEFYKEFNDVLLDPMFEMFKDSLSGKGLPQTLQDTNISVILKKGKPPESCSSYRPIALLNVDRKVLSKIVAVRLEGILPLIIKADQTGFIKGRNSCDNVRRLLNIIEVFKQRGMDAWFFH